MLLRYRNWFGTKADALRIAALDLALNLDAAAARDLAATPHPHHRQPRLRLGQQGMGNHDAHAHTAQVKPAVRNDIELGGPRTYSVSQCLF